MAQTGQTAKPGLWERLDPPTKVIAALFAIVVSAIAIVGGIIAIVGNPFSPNPQDVEAQKNAIAISQHEVDKCVKAHGLAAEHVQEGDPVLAAHRTFKGCDWPPPSTASGIDGYTVIHDAVTRYPKPAAAPWNELNALQAPCERLTISLVLYQMSSRSFRNATLQPGPVYLAGARAVDHEPTLVVRKLNQVPFDVQLPAPSGAGQYFVLLDGHTRLLDARCSSP